MHGLDLQKLIEKYELIPGMAQSDVVSAWCKMVERPAAELPRLLRTLGADWENRFAAFPVERLARPVRQDNGQDHKKPEEPKPEEPLTYGAVLSAILKRNPKYIGRGMLGEPKYQRHWMPTTRFLQLVPADHHELLEHPMAIHDGVGIAHIVHIEEMGRTQVILRQGWNSDILPETLGLGSDGFVVYPDDDRSYLRLSVRDFERKAGSAFHPNSSAPTLVNRAEQRQGATARRIAEITGPRRNPGVPSALKRLSCI